MGKEIKGVIQCSSRKSFVSHGMNTIDFKREIDTQWNPCQPPNIPIIKENGKVVVSIISGYAEKKVICGGLALYGNSYCKLLKMLRKKGYIHSGKRVQRIFIDKGFVNVRVESRNDYFSAGEKIILILNRGLKKSIRKVNKEMGENLNINKTRTGA